MSVDMRYRYQVHELNVPFPAGTVEITDKEMEELYARFDELYEKAYGAGSGYSEAGKEIMTFRVIAIGALRKPHIKEYALEKVGSDETVKGEREVYFEEERGFVKTRIYDFDRMKPGMEIPGPAVIETPVTTILVNPRDHAVMDGFRNVKLLIGA
jgi:N-methylhydantoinase A